MDDIILTPLRKINNQKGDVFHAIKKSDVGFYGFGEAYFSFVNKGIIKEWRKHSKMTLNLIVPVGEVKFVIYKENTNKFLDISLSPDNYQRLTIKPGLWVAFEGKSHLNMILNLANIEHDKSESISKDLKEFKYDWQ